MPNLKLSKNSVLTLNSKNLSMESHHLEMIQEEFQRNYGGRSKEGSFTSQCKDNLKSSGPTTKGYEAIEHYKDFMVKYSQNVGDMLLNVPIVVKNGEVMISQLSNMSSIELCDHGLEGAENNFDSERVFSKLVHAETRSEVSLSKKYT